MQPPKGVLDESRLALLDAYGILDTPDEPGFDDIVHLAAQVGDVPVALVSLVAADRQWFKARVGFQPSQTDLDSSVCAYALVEPDLLIIPDLTQDERTRSNPLVTGPPFIRFYAGAPLRATTGEVLGSLCVIDVKPRPDGLTSRQASGLRSLARLVMSQLDLRRAVVDRDVLVAEQHRAEARRTGLLRLGDRLRDLNSVAEMTRAASAIVGSTLEVSRAGFGRLTDNDETMVVEPDWTVQGLASIAGAHRLSDYGELRAEILDGAPLVIVDVRTDARTRSNPNPLLDLGACSLVNMPVRERGRTVALFFVHDQQPREWSTEVLAFLRNVADRVEVGVARLKAEADQRVLNHELSHRMKNTFAMVQAIALQTLRSVADQQPVEAFTQRLHTLSTAHDVLLLQNWSAANIDAVIRAVLKALVELPRVHVSGPRVELDPRATLSLSLLIHELATNALKHGSLSHPQGRLAVTWRLDGEGAETELALSWRETGGPPAEQPKRKGFGSKLIRLGLVGTGGVDLRYVPAGLEADFKAPLARVQCRDDRGSSAVD